ncbi:MAG: hypothetical protein HY369_04440 [Candidatus Aenigmarchaeota archaeon]|nr:hypothetical protein [Candidatus Aenigmarchaeota archaeon]
MLQGKAKAAVPAFLIVVLIALLVVVAGSLRAPAGDLSLQPPRPVQSHSGSSGDPGWPEGAPHCYVHPEGITCYDKDGNVIPYHCGNVISSYGSSQDTHENGVCDVDEVHCPAALGDARTAGAAACPEICPVYTETGAKWTAACLMTLNGDSFTYCDAEVFGTCTEVQEE